jgi:hypothetical protein
VETNIRTRSAVKELSEDAVLDLAVNERQPERPTMRHFFGTRPNLRRIASALAASGVSGFSSGSFAQYDAIAYGGGFGPGGIIGHTTAPGDVSYTYSGPNASSVTTFTSSPVASVSYSGTAFNPVGQGGTAGGGIMTYRFEVAAQPFTNVPIDFSGLYSASGSRTSC